MQECEVYVDPDEDEVFFGCVSEKEKCISGKLVKRTEPASKEDCIPSVILDENSENTLNNEQASRGISTNEPANNSVNLDHNYSTPMKHRIDKTILTTPKSVVKADKDGGFLKVLSEIALVKAEVEGDKRSDEKKEDEDKENQMVRAIPVIKVTEATPEKAKIVSPPKSVSSQLRRFRIIYNSPQSEDNVEVENCNGLEDSKNLRNKCLDQDFTNSGKGGVLSSDRNSIDLIDFNDSIPPNEVLKVPDKIEAEPKEERKLVEVTGAGGDGEKYVDEGESIPPLATEEGTKNDEPEIIAVLPPLQKEARPEPQRKLPRGYRFSKEARKIVEVLKKSTADDTLDFTIDEIDVENVDNSLVSPEPVSSFDVTVVQKPDPLAAPKPVTHAKTVEKERHKLTPVLSQSKIRGVKYFSEKRVVNQVGSGVKKCVKKLPMEDKRAVAEAKPAVGKEANGPPTSRIPVFGTKSSRIPVHATAASRAPTTRTPLKTPTGKSHRNPKYKNIESPINAYIHNKPTSLVLNVKSEVKRGPLTKVSRPDGSGSARKPEQKPSRDGSATKPVRLPYVEYRSATPYEIEKRPESRLPRLAPTVQKLLGSHSPRILKHEGRFYVNSPRKKTSSAAEDTILADPNEVSLVVSQAAQMKGAK